jgi:ABC-2 type transport system ATP-binding protein
VADVSLSVRRGEIFGILGPNGAGKTTSVESIIGLRAPDGGTVRVLGHDPRTDRDAIIGRIGIQLQEAHLPERIRVHEALALFSSFYDRPVAWEPLLAQWGLSEKRDTYFKDLSGGQKQRLFIALALLNDPEVVFLDELTTGLDPQARRSTWELIRAIREQGKTVVLVTHFMDEAEVLCDRLAIIDHGRVIALDTPQALIAGLRGDTRIIFSTANGFDSAALRDVDGVSRIDVDGSQVTVHGSGQLLLRVATALTAQNLDPLDLRVERPNLEDVFIALTGRALRA